MPQQQGKYSAADVAGKYSPDDVAEVVTDNTPAPTVAPKQAPERFARGFNRNITGAETPQELGSNVAPLLNPRTAGTTAMDFVQNTLQSIPEQSQELTERAQQDASTGHPIKAFFHQAAADIPIVGPALSSAADEFASGNVAGALGAGTALSLPFAGPKVGELATRAGEIAPRIPETIRKGAQSAVGAGERNVRPIVAKEAQAASDTARKTIASNREAPTTHAKEVADTRASNAEALRAQKKIPQTQEKLQTGSRELQGQIETARNNALKIGNEKYNGVNEKLNDLPADLESLHEGYIDAHGSLKGTENDPPVLNSIAKRLEEGDAFTYRDLQGYYSELNTELSKGTLPGDVYHALDTLHEAVGNDMQRIADSQGAGAELKDARAYWRRMKQTFGKPYNPTDAGNVTLEKATGTAATDEQANRVRLLGSFDKGIPSTVEHLGNVRKGAAALPKEQPVRNVVKPMPAAPETAQIHPVDVNTRAVRQTLLDRWTSGEGTMNKYQVKALVSGGLGAVLGGLFGHGEGASIGALAGYALGPAGIAKLVESPAVREWLTRPPAEELEALRSLPSADRLRITDTLKTAAKSAQSQGVKVSPALYPILGLGANIAPRKHPSDEYAGH